MFSLAIDFVALTLLGISLFLIFFLKLIKPTFSVPHFKFSNLSSFKTNSWKTALLPFSFRLHKIALCSFMLAFIDPHLSFPVSMDKKIPPFPKEGIAMYLLIDQSGSMIAPLQIRGEDKMLQTVTKIDFLKQVTKQFIQAHSSDLIGLVSFARTAHLLTPLTLDQQKLLSDLKKIEVVEEASQDGTAMGYAIFKTAHLITAAKHFAEDLRQEGQSAYTVRNTVIIVLTDGLQDPSLLDRGNRLRTIELDEAAAYVKSQNIRLYVVNIDPALTKEDYAPQRHQLEKITSLTGGKFFSVKNFQNLSSVYEEIDHLEKEEISSFDSMDQLVLKLPKKRFSFYPFLIACGLLSLFSALFIQSFVARVSP